MSNLTCDCCGNERRRFTYDKNKAMVVCLSCDTSNFDLSPSNLKTYTVHEYFDDSLGQVVKGKSHIQKICRENDKVYASIQETDQETKKNRQNIEREVYLETTAKTKEYIKAALDGQITYERYVNEFRPQAYKERINKLSQKGN